AQAQADAKLAREAANRAFADATAARNAANQAEAEASRARGAAAEADSHAVAANSAANLAEHEASVAQGAAAQAEKDAADANKFAESADGHAKSAEAAAKNANTYAREADEAAKKAEEYELEQQRKAREAAATKINEGISHLELTDEEIAALKAAGITPEQWAMARQLDKKGFLDFLVENGGQIIVDLLFEDIENCFEKPNFEDCFWAAVGALPWGKALKIIKEMPAIAKALKSIVTGLNDFLDKSAAAKKLMAKADEILEKVRKNPPCPAGRNGPKSFAQGAPVFMVDGPSNPIQGIRVHSSDGDPVDLRGKSMTVWRSGPYRIDIEGSPSGVQMHFQQQKNGIKSSDAPKYHFNPDSGEFDGMPNSLKKELKKKYPDYGKGLVKAVDMFKRVQLGTPGCP
ncbi:hypothetical protein ACWGAU_38540, partial [Streptomyces sp. NPDC054952]